MLFNSIQFLIFLPLVYVLYWFVFKKSLKYQNILVIVASYVFYGWWDWRFLFLIVFSTLLDFYVGRRIFEQGDNRKKAKYWLWVSVFFNLGLLGFFKYYNFFIDSFIDMFSAFGYQMKSTWTLRIILPVGISFYTFQRREKRKERLFSRTRTLLSTESVLSFSLFARSMRERKGKDILICDWFSPNC